jgi:hypothetical protein
MSYITNEFPRKVPLAIRSNKSPHDLIKPDDDSIYSFYTVMTVDTGSLKWWWERWCDMLNYPDTKSLLDYIYIHNDFPWFSSEFKEVVDHFRKSQRMLPLLRDDFARLILPQLHVFFMTKRFIRPRR